MEAGEQVGRYVLTSRYPDSGMAEVWLAHLAGESGFRDFLLKLLPPHRTKDPACVQQFTSEALLGSVLDHPNIVPVFDHGQVRDSYFIAREYVGRTLRSIEAALNKTGARLPVWLVTRAVVAVCDVLEHANSLKDVSGSPLRIVHRDITPENVMVSFQGVTKVLDVFLTQSTTSRAAAGCVQSQLAYRAPEQITGTSGLGNEVRVDVYALGVMLYELLTGRHPFQGANELALFKEIREKVPAPPRALEPSIPLELESICLRAMARSPEDRFRSTTDLREYLEGFMLAQGAYPTSRQIADFMNLLFGEEESFTTPVFSESPALSELARPVSLQPTLLSSNDFVSLDDLPEDPPSDPLIADELDRLVLNTPPLLGLSESALLGPPHQADKPPSQMATGEVRMTVPTASSEVAKPASPRAKAPDPRSLRRSSSAGGAFAATQVNQRSAAVLFDSSGAKPSEQKAGTGWAALTERMRKEKERHSGDSNGEEPAAAPEPKAEAPAREGPAAHAWDSLLQKVQRIKEEVEVKPEATPQPEREKVKEPALPPRLARAREQFDQGLRQMAAKDHAGALRSLEEALHLDPDNRLYQSNLRILKRLIDATK